MDFYELTMSNAYLNEGLKNKIVYFDMFFRKIPENGGFVIMSGVEQVIEYIEIEYRKEQMYYVFPQDEKLIYISILSYFL